MKLRIADLYSPTFAFGREPKMIIWLQGCPKRCKACIAPEWQTKEGGKEVDVQELANFVLSQNDLEGLVLSGGEPLWQRKSLFHFLKLLENKLGVICYTGYSKEEINFSLMKQSYNFFDLLITGEYLEELNDSKGIRGSSNQSLHFITDRYISEKEYFIHGTRQVELNIDNGTALLVGVPPKGFNPNAVF